MFGIPKGSIQQRLFVPLTITIFILFSGGSFFTYLIVRNALIRQIDNHLKRTAEDFIAETERLVTGEIESEFHELNLTHFRPEGRQITSFYELRDAKGNTILKSRSLKNSNLSEGSNDTYSTINLHDEIKGRVYSKRFTVEFEVMDPDDRGDKAEIAAFTPEETDYITRYDPNAPQNQVTVTVAESLVELNRTLVLLSLILVTTGLLLATATFYVLYLIIRKACRPVIELAVMTETIRTDSLDVRLPTETVPSEIKPLVVKVNELIGRLDEAMQKERRFAIDIAHELRTPVSEIRTLMEVAAASVPDDYLTPGEENPGEFFSIGAQISERMSRLIEVLTSIHNGTSGDFVTENELVNFEALCIESLNGLNLNEADKNRIQISCEQSIEVSSDPTLLRAIVDNLLTNATVWSPSGTAIHVKCLSRTIEISNMAESLTPEDLKDLKNAFWQKDGARTESNHFGLGLTLVSVYVGLLGGTIKHGLKNSIFTTTITLPQGVDAT